jgi:hypothetical protein
MNEQAARACVQTQFEPVVEGSATVERKFVGKELNR